MIVFVLFFMGTMYIKANGINFKHHMFRKIIPKYTADSNIVSLPGLVNTNSSSDVSCGRQCASVDWCLSFGYDATMNTCSLYNTNIPIVTYTSTSTSIYSDRCPAYLGFKYETSLHFCYWISTYMHTWQFANYTCHNKGGTLAKTNKAEILNFLFQLTSTTNVWVDGNDLAAEGTFVWSDGDILPINGDIWDHGTLPQPDGSAIKDEDCCMIINWGPKLHDEKCNAYYIFVCEYNL